MSRLLGTLLGETMMAVRSWLLYNSIAVAPVLSTAACELQRHDISTGKASPVSSSGRASHTRVVACVLQQKRVIGVACV